MPTRPERSASSPTLSLQRSQSAKLRTTAATQIHCRSGLVWITLDHDLRDVVLNAGQSFSVPAGATVLASALSGPVTLELVQRPAAATMRRAASGLSEVLHPLRRWMASRSSKLMGAAS